MSLYKEVLKSEHIDEINKFCELLGDYALEPAFDELGAGFYQIKHNTGHVHFSGKLASITYYFKFIVTDRLMAERLIQRIEANKRTDAYLKLKQALSERRRAGHYERLRTANEILNNPLKNT